MCKKEAKGDAIVVEEEEEVRRPELQTALVVLVAVAVVSPFINKDRIALSDACCRLRHIGYYVY